MFEEREHRWRAWMTQAQLGDAAAYEKLLLELLPHLRGFVRRRLRDPEVAEDVVQNILLSLHRARSSYRAERPFGPWLHAVARHAVVDHTRATSRRRMRELSLEEDGVPEPRAPAEALDPHAPLSAELSIALATLPSGQRQAVSLIHLDGLSVSDAAARVGISPGALKVRAHRGYKALRRLLATGDD